VVVQVARVGVAGVLLLHGGGGVHHVLILRQVLLRV